MRLSRFIWSRNPLYTRDKLQYRIGFSDKRNELSVDWITVSEGSTKDRKRKQKSAGGAAQSVWKDSKWNKHILIHFSCC